MKAYKASNGARIGAYLLDTLIIMALSYFFSRISLWIWGVFTFCGVFLYYGICDGSSLHGTLGKRIVGIMVTDDEGRTLNYRQSFTRSACRLLTGLTLGIGMIIGLFDEDGKTLHDKLAHTRVLRREALNIGPGLNPIPVVPSVNQGPRGYDPNPTPTRPVPQSLLPTEPTGPQLMAVTGPAAGGIVRVPSRGVMLGCDPFVCVLPVREGTPGVSHQHCRIEFSQQQNCFVLTDYSTYGTYTSSGQRFPKGAPVRLGNGTEFCLGNKTIRYRVTC